MDTKRHVTRPVVRNWLCVHFVIWWLLSAYLWIRGYHVVWVGVTSAIAPVTLGLSFLRPQSYSGWGLLGLASSAAMAGLSYYSVTRVQRWWWVALAHLSVVAYWLMSGILISTGV